MESSGTTRFLVAPTFGALEVAQKARKTSSVQSCGTVRAEKRHSAHRKAAQCQTLGLMQRPLFTVRLGTI